MAKMYNDCGGLKPPTTTKRELERLAKMGQKAKSQPPKKGKSK